MEDLGKADLVIEAVFENMALKKEIFAKLDKIAKPGAIIATNTSTLDVDEIAAVTKRPQDVVGLHFFSPANIMRLLEIVRAEKTGNDVMATAMAIAKKIGKVGVQAGVCDGFVGNRMLAAYGGEVQAMNLEGAMPQEIDGALEAWGMAMGPLAVSDLAGLDVGYRIRKERKLTGEAAQFARVPDKIVEMGRHGQKTGAGYYKYDANRKRMVDPEIEALIRAEAEALQIKQRHIPADEIVERCLLRLANEGAKILEEGIALQRQRHRHHVPERLRLPGLARRPHVAGRQRHRHEEGGRAHQGLRGQVRRPLEDRPADREAGRRRRHVRRAGREEEVRRSSVRSKTSSRSHSSTAKGAGFLLLLSRSSPSAAVGDGRRW